MLYNTSSNTSTRCNIWHLHQVWAPAQVLVPRTALLQTLKGCASPCTSYARDANLKGGQVALSPCMYDVQHCLEIDWQETVVKSTAANPNREPKNIDIYIYVYIYIYTCILYCMSCRVNTFWKQWLATLSMKATHEPTGPRLMGPYHPCMDGWLIGPLGLEPLSPYLGPIQPMAWAWTQYWYQYYCNMCTNSNSNTNNSPNIYRPLRPLTWHTWAPLGPVLTNWTHLGPTREQ